jgi:hypothetical protein
MVADLVILADVKTETRFKPMRRKGSRDFVKDFALCGYPGVMAAVLLQAKLDAEAGDQEAFDWLLSGVADDLCFAVGYNYANVICWLADLYLKK